MCAHTDMHHGHCWLPSLAADFNGNHAWKDHKLWACRQRGRSILWNAASPHMRLELVTRCFCFCLAAEREIKSRRKRLHERKGSFPLRYCDCWLLSFKTMILAWSSFSWEDRNSQNNGTFCLWQEYLFTIAKKKGCMCWDTCVVIQTCFLPDSKNAIPGHCLPVLSWGETTSIPASPHTEKISIIAGEELLRSCGFFSQTETDCNGWCGKMKLCQVQVYSCLRGRKLLSFYFPWYLGGGRQNKNAELGFTVFTAGSFDSLIAIQALTWKRRRRSTNAGGVSWP